MTDLLEKAVAAVRRMPAAEQDTIAQAMLSLARICAGADSEDIEPEHSAAVSEGIAQADRGAFATDETGRPPSAASSGDAASHPPRGRRPET